MQPPFLQWAGGVEPQKKEIKYGGLDKTSTFRVVCWERGGDFFGGDGVAIFT